MIEKIFATIPHFSFEYLIDVELFINEAKAKPLFGEIFVTIVLNKIKSY